MRTLNNCPDLLVDNGLRRYNIEGISIVDGDPEQDWCYEWAHSSEEAMKQAIRRALGTNFHPKRTVGVMTCS